MGWQTFHDTDIAMIEHDIITQNELLEWKPEDAIWYLTGVHEFAEKLIRIINEKDGDE